MIAYDDQVTKGHLYGINTDYLGLWASPTLRSRLRRQLRLGLTILVALNLLDLGSTFTALALGANEANPLARVLLSASPLMLVALKVVVLGTLLWAARRAPVQRALCGVWMLVGVYSMVVLNNSVVVWKLTHG